MARNTNLSDSELEAINGGALEALPRETDQDDTGGGGGGSRDETGNNSGGDQQISM